MNIDFDDLIGAWLTYNNGGTLRSSELYALADNLGICSPPRTQGRGAQIAFGRALVRLVGRSSNGHVMRLVFSGSHRYYYLRDETQLARDHLT